MAGPDMCTLAASNESGLMVSLEKREEGEGQPRDLRESIASRYLQSSVYKAVYETYKYALADEHAPWVETPVFDPDEDQLATLTLFEKVGLVDSPDSDPSWIKSLNPMALVAGKTDLECSQNGTIQEYVIQDGPIKRTLYFDTAASTARIRFSSAEDYYYLERAPDRENVAAVPFIETFAL